MLSANPAAVTPFWLSTAEDLPAETRPAFLIGFLTPRQLEEHAAILEQARRPDTPDVDWRDLMHKAIAIGVRGWRNVNDAEGKPRPFTREEMDDPERGLTDRELAELAQRYPSVVRITRAQKVFSDPSSPTPTGKSANAAATEPASRPET